MNKPPIAALFLTHFHDTQGQTVTYYKSFSETSLPAPGIEHKTLPSGLHSLHSDQIYFTHHGYPAVGIFRSKERPRHEGGRGRRMDTLGVVLPKSDGAGVDDLFAYASGLEELWDKLDQVGGDLTEGGKENTQGKEIMDDYWKEHGGRVEEGSQGGNGTGGGITNWAAEEGRVRELISGTDDPSPRHPIQYLPVLLAILGPTLVPIYKAAISGKRILLYSPPPLLPLAAYSWCIHALSLPPASAASSSTSRSVWIGNVGLMDMDEMKAMQGGWVATTSDAIYQSHPSTYDIFIDLSLPNSASPSSFSTPPQTDPSAQQPKIHLSTSPTQTIPLTYQFADLALYRSLLLLNTSPSSITASPITHLSKKGGVWLLAFELLERVWSLCVGVCEYAVGREQVGEGSIRLDMDMDGDDIGEGEEDALPLLGEVDEGDLQVGRDGDGMSNEGVRKGRLILRQLHHNSHHLYLQLKQVVKRDEQRRSGKLSEGELKRLCGKGWTIWGGRLSGTVEGVFWNALAIRWGLVGDEGDVKDIDEDE